MDPTICCEDLPYSPHSHIWRGCDSSFRWSLRLPRWSVGEGTACPDDQMDSQWTSNFSPSKAAIKCSCNTLSSTLSSTLQHTHSSRNIQNFGTSRHISDEASLRWSAESPRDLPIDFHRGSQRWSYGGSAAYLAPPGSCGSNWWSLVEKVCWKVSKHLEKVEKVTNFNLESVNMCESVSMCLQILVPFQIFQVSNSIKAWIVNVKRHQSCKSSDIGPNCFCQNRKNEASHLRRWQPQQSKQPDRQSQTEVKWHSQSKSNLMKCTQSCPFSVTSRTPFCPTFRHSYMTGVRSDAVSAPASYSRGTADPVVNLVLLIDVLFPIGWLINRGVCLLL